MPVLLQKREPENEGFIGIYRAPIMSHGHEVLSASFRGGMSSGNCCIFAELFDDISV